MAKLLNKDPQLYAAERDRFLRELRQFHNGQRCDPRVFWGLILGFFKPQRGSRSRRCRQVMARPRGQAAAGPRLGPRGERGKQPWRSTRENRGRRRGERGALGPALGPGARPGTGNPHLGDPRDPLKPRAVPCKIPLFKIQDGGCIRGWLAALL